MRLSDLASCDVAVWGAGRDGQAAIEHLITHGCRVTLVSDDHGTDRGAKELADRWNIDLVAPGALATADIAFLVRSPGVSRYRDEVTALSERGVASANLFALWLADQDPARVIAVTGTKGKSTTATLIAALLERLGHRTTLVGNIGVPVTRIDAEMDVVVVEVSSYQASDCTSSPSIGVLTGLGQDHITWHGSLARYHADKVNLFAHRQLRRMVFHEDDPVVRAALESIGADAKAFAVRMATHELSTLMERTGASDRFGTTTFPRNLSLAIAATTAHDPNLGEDDIVSVLSDFTGLDSRQETIGVIDGVSYVDDALASNPLAVMAAIERFADAPMVLIIGGHDRTVDYGDLAALINRAPHLDRVVVMGPDGDPLAERLVPLIENKAVRCPSHEVPDAVEMARDLVRPNGRIVFSPGAPTPPQSGDYTVRSRSFRDAATGASNLD